MHDSTWKRALQQSGQLFAVAEREGRRDTGPLVGWRTDYEDIKEDEASAEPSSLQWLKAGATVTSGWAI